MNEDNNPEIRPDNEKRFGSLLKKQREKKGLSISQVAGITRLRKHFLEALENEEWEKLPARVFVKGFIRSYALSVDLDVNEAMRLFEASAPRAEEENYSKALITAEKRKSKFIYFLIPLIALAGIIFYFSSEWDWNKSNVAEPEIPPIYRDSGSEITETARHLESPDPVTEEYPVKKEINQNTETTETDLLNMPPEKDGEESSQAKISAEDIKEVINENSDRETETTEMQDSPPARITEGEDSWEDTSMDDGGLVLTGIVSMRTYIKIFVDDNPPKEYIFRPGSRPQWTGEKGFYVVVGNAAGVEFDFNGTTIKDLGKSGRVKNIRFPEDFRSEWEE